MLRHPDPYISLKFLLYYIMEKTKKEKPVVAKKPKWEYKDRQYFLKGNKEPVVYILQSKNVMWFDEELF